MSIVYQKPGLSPLIGVWNEILYGTIAQKYVAANIIAYDQNTENLKKLF